MQQKKHAGRTRESGIGKTRIKQSSGSGNTGKERRQRQEIMQKLWMDAYKYRNLTESRLRSRAEEHFNERRSKHDRRTIGEGRRERDKGK